MAGDDSSAEVPFSVGWGLFGEGDPDEGGDELIPFSVAWDLLSAYRGGSYKFATGAIPTKYLGAGWVRFRGTCDNGSVVDAGLTMRAWDYGLQLRYPDNPEKWTGGGYLDIKGVAESFECRFGVDVDSLRRDVDRSVSKVREWIAQQSRPGSQRSPD